MEDHKSDLLNGRMIPFNDLNRSYSGKRWRKIQPRNGPVSSHSIQLLYIGRCPSPKHVIFI